MRIASREAFSQDVVDFCVFLILIQLLVQQHGFQLIELLFLTPPARLKNTTARGDLNEMQVVTALLKQSRNTWQGRQLWGVAELKLVIGLSRGPRQR